jgi:hypothetical protein
MCILRFGHFRRKGQNRRDICWLGERRYNRPVVHGLILPIRICIILSRHSPSGLDACQGKTPDILMQIKVWLRPTRDKALHN